MWSTRARSIGIRTKAFPSNFQGMQNPSVELNKTYSIFSFADHLSLVTILCLILQPSCSWSSNPPAPELHCRKPGRTRPKIRLHTAAELRNQPATKQSSWPPNHLNWNPEIPHTSARLSCTTTHIYTHPLSLSLVLSLLPTYRYSCSGCCRRWCLPHDISPTRCACDMSSWRECRWRPAALVSLPR